MTFTNNNKSLLVYIFAGIITWALFFFSFIFITKALMMFMEFTILAFILIFISIIMFFLNYLIFRYVYTSSQHEVIKDSTLLRTQHSILLSLDRITSIIILLVTLGLISAISTFILISMSFMATNDFMAIIEPIPFLFVLYLIFIIPSFIGIIEIGKLRAMLQNYSKIKNEVKQKLNQ